LIIVAERRAASLFDCLALVVWVSAVAIVSIAVGSSRSKAFIALVVVERVVQEYTHTDTHIHIHIRFL